MVFGAWSPWLAPISAPVWPTDMDCTRAHGRGRPLRDERTPRSDTDARLSRMSAGTFPGPRPARRAVPLFVVLQWPVAQLTPCVCLSARARFVAPGGNQAGQDQTPIIRREGASTNLAAAPSESSPIRVRRRTVPSHPGGRPAGRHATRPACGPARSCRAPSVGARSRGVRVFHRLLANRASVVRNQHPRAAADRASWRPGAGAFRRDARSFRRASRRGNVGSTREVRRRSA